MGRAPVKTSTAEVMASQIARAGKYPRPLDRLDQPLLAERLIASVRRLGDAVGEQHEKVPAGRLDRRRVIARAVENAEHRSAFGEAIGDPSPVRRSVQPDGRQMTGIDDSAAGRTRGSYTHQNSDANRSPDDFSSSRALRRAAARSGSSFEAPQGGALIAPWMSAISSADDTPCPETSPRTNDTLPPGSVTIS